MNLRMKSAFKFWALNSKEISERKATTGINRVFFRESF